ASANAPRRKGRMRAHSSRSVPGRISADPRADGVVEWTPVDLMGGSPLAQGDAHTMSHLGGCSLSVPWHDAPRLAWELARFRTPVVCSRPGLTARRAATRLGGALP